MIVESREWRATRRVACRLRFYIRLVPLATMEYPSNAEREREREREREIEGDPARSSSTFKCERGPKLLFDFVDSNLRFLFVFACSA